MKYQLKATYTDGEEIYDLTKEELDEIYINVVIPHRVILDVNAILRIAKKRHKEFNSGTKGDIKE